MQDLNTTDVLLALGLLVGWIALQLLLPRFGVPT